MTHDAPNDLIAELAGDLQPVSAIRPRQGWAILTAAIAATATFIALYYGFRDGIANGSFSVFFPITSGLLAMLGLATGASVIRMANPNVGNVYDGPRWAMAMAAILPASALVLLGLRGGDVAELVDAGDGWLCSARGFAAALLIAIVLFAWLRRGAPVNPRKAGLYLGISSSALGSAIYGLACPNDTLFHLGLWHMLPVAIGGAIGMALVPRLVRW